MKTLQALAELSHRHPGSMVVLLHNRDGEMWAIRRLAGKTDDPRYSAQRNAEGSQIPVGGMGGIIELIQGRYTPELGWFGR